MAFSLSEGAAWGLGLLLGITIGAVIMGIIALIVYKVFLEDDDDVEEMGDDGNEASTRINVEAPASSSRERPEIVVPTDHRHSVADDPTSGRVSISGVSINPLTSPTSTLGTPMEQNPNDPARRKWSVASPKMSSGNLSEDDTEEMEEYEEEVEELVEVRQRGEGNGEDDLDVTTIMMKKKVKKMRPKKRGDRKKSVQHDKDRFKAAMNAVNATTAFKEKKKKPLHGQWKY